MTATFYLGTHEPKWLGFVTVPLMVSRARAAHRPMQRWPAAVGRYVLDSGGFSELSQHGRWTIDAHAYVAFVREMVERVGRPDWVAPMDSMCEPFIVAKTGRAVADHIADTVDNFCTLREALGPLVIPVLQGYGPRDYDRCVDRYAAAGVDLTAEQTVGVGSVCRRSGTREANRLLCYLADYGLRLHGFGIKGATWRACRSFLTSADSLAWSFAARMAGGNANGLADALLWRSRLVADAPHTFSVFPDPARRSPTGFGPDERDAQGGKPLTRQHGEDTATPIALGHRLRPVASRQIGRATTPTQTALHVAAPRRTPAV